MIVNLSEYRGLILTGFKNGWTQDLAFLAEFLPRMSLNLRTLRGMNMFGWYTAVLVEGADVLREPYSLLEPIFEDQCQRQPQQLTTGELTLTGHANLFACAGWIDYITLFRERLSDVRTKRNSEFAARHHAKALAGIALGEKALYRDPVGADVLYKETMPFTPYARHGYNPQSFLAHLAGAVETHAAIEEVWPAFEEFLFNFPGHEQTGEFDGSCLFWVARIVHHQIGGQPLGETAAWLHRHFNAWADGDELPPIGA
jgi:hypothetical protein